MKAPRAANRLPSSGCWPNAMQDLLLTAALAEPREAVEAWQAWCRQTTVDDIDQASFRLLPQVYLTLAPLGALGDDEPRLRGVYRQNWARNQRRVHVAAKAIAALTQAGIPTLCLKGLAFGRRYYGNLGARSMADVDIVTHDADVERALGVLETEGWHLRYEPFAREHRRGASTPLVNATGDELDLHWHVLFVRPFDDADEAFWRGSEVLSVGEAASRGLQPADDLLHTLVHGLHWNSVNALRWIADAVVVLRASPHLDWDRFFTLASRLDLGCPVSTALAYLATRFPAVVAGDVVERASRLPRTTGDRLEWWARMRGPSMPPGRVGYVFRYWRQYRRLRRGDHAATRRGFIGFVSDALRVDGAGALARAAAQHGILRRG